MTAPWPAPTPKDPLAVTAAALRPPGLRSRAALGLAVAAAQGRFMLQRCDGCGAFQYPPREVCGACLSTGLRWCDAPAEGRLLARTTVRISGDPYFRSRVPWPVALVQLGCGPQVVAHLHGDVAAAGAAVRMALRIDKAGQGVMVALPGEETPYMQDDPMWREMTCDPRGRRVLVTDGRGALGQAMARAMLEAGARAVFVGIAEAWRPHGGAAALAGMEMVPLDLTDQDSVQRMAASLGGRVEILVNTALHLRPGPVLGQDMTGAREAMELNYLGALRLAQALGPAMQGRAGDGTHPACAWVNLISAQALVPSALGGAGGAQAAALGLAQALRPALRPLRVVNALLGPLDDDWHQAVPPPKLAPGAVAAAVVRALRDGVEDVAVGDVAQDILARWTDNAAILLRDSNG